MRKRSSRSSTRARAAERDVRAHAHVREERVLLEHEADGARLGREVDARGGVEPRLAVARDPAPVRAAQPGDRAQHGRLARARRADERDRLAPGAQAELELVRAKGDGDVELERRHEESSLYDSRIVALSTTSRTLIASAMSKFDSSCS